MSDEDDPTARWSPDDQLISSCRNGGRSMSDLAPPDRCWAVAGLTRLGLTAAETADLLDCSLRLVRSVRADPMTLVCAMYMAEADHFRDELRLARSELRIETCRHAETAADRERIKAQLDRLLDAHLVGAVDTCSQGHPMTEYNTYRRPNGTRSCRECHRARQAGYRARRVLPRGSTDSEIGETSTP